MWSWISSACLFCSWEMRGPLSTTPSPKQQQVAGYKARLTRTFGVMKAAPPALHSPAASSQQDGVTGAPAQLLLSASLWLWLACLSYCHLARMSRRIPTRHWVKMAVFT